MIDIAVKCGVFTRSTSTDMVKIMECKIDFFFTKHLVYLEIRNLDSYIMNIKLNVAIYSSCSRTVGIGEFVTIIFTMSMCNMSCQKSVSNSKISSISFVKWVHLWTISVLNKWTGECGWCHILQLGLYCHWWGHWSRCIANWIRIRMCLLDATHAIVYPQIKWHNKQYKKKKNYT